MFDIGFLELLVIFVIALLVLGPERLPKAAHKAGRWVGQAKRLMSQWSSEINRQIENEELKQTLQQNGELQELSSELDELNKSISQSLSGYELGRVETHMPVQDVAKNDQSQTQVKSA